MRLLKELAWLILESVERFNVLDGEQGQVGDSRTEGGQINVQALHRIRERVDAMSEVIVCPGTESPFLPIKDVWPHAVAGNAVKYAIRVESSCSLRKLSTARMRGFHETVTGGGDCVT